MTKQYLLAANWKMNVDFNETKNFIKDHGENLIKLVNQKNISLVVCPSFPSLYMMNTIFEGTPVAIGAQNCSSHINGSFTGEVSPKCIHQTGCTYCIIGHSEQRKYHSENNDEDIIKKFVHLMDYDISPIICIGETEEEHKAGNTIQIISKQLEGILLAIRSVLVPEYLEICIAYEPVWAIGTGEIPSQDHLDLVFGWITSKLQNTPDSVNYKLLYGGSVDKENIKGIKSIGSIDGFLVGKASIYYDQLESMINVLTK